ncbi:MAG TPA: cation-translocating P-type ATPase [Methylophilaceae bacterium]|nr:cation-translocating P-type ATPase [Methylophilaceae bacterium]
MSEFPSGLSHRQAAARLARDGANEIPRAEVGAWRALLAEIAGEPMFLLLLGAGVIYLFTGDTREALLLLGFVVVIMIITTLQERRTQHALEALRDLSSPRALAIREGRPLRIAGRDIVREDVLILNEGDRIPADGALIGGHELVVDESLLTGESAPVTKFDSDLLVFAGTLVVKGQGIMRVSATGIHSALGRIGRSLQTIGDAPSPLRREIGQLTRRLAILAACLCIGLTLLHWGLRGEWVAALLSGITLAMSILPQEFPVIMTIMFALGARRIARQRVLTRRLNAIETLGETTVLCVDKTGTLTENRMALAALSVDGELLECPAIEGQALPEHYHELLEYAVLASELAPHDPMERAFHRYAHAYLANTEHLHPDWSLVHEYELTPELLAMTHLWRGDGESPDVVAAKGAPEAIADLCHLSATAHAALREQVEQLASRGLRVLAVAKARHPARHSWPAIQHDFDFTLVGLLGLADPLRSNVPAAIAECQAAGIRVVMITGDYARTASAIAAQAGIAHRSVLTGDALRNMETKDLQQAIREAGVFARVTPQQKLMIVDALKAEGAVVAMTGDGVNDAPALKAAHIGIAMGKRGTDVAREAASLVLLEDDFAAIVSAVRLGRRIFANLRQAFMYTFAVHVPIIALSIVPVLLGSPWILAPIHIAFLELVINPACSLVFEAESGGRDLMHRSPRSTHEPLMTLGHIALSLTEGLIVAVAAAAIYLVTLQAMGDSAAARTSAFMVLVVANLVLIFPNRAAAAGLRSQFAHLPKASLWVLAATLTALALVTHVPPLVKAFGFNSPTLSQWLLTVVASLAALLCFEAAKRVFGWLESRHAKRQPVAAG